MYLPKTNCDSPLLPSNAAVGANAKVNTSMSFVLDKKNKIIERIKEQNAIERYLVKMGSCGNQNSLLVKDIKARLFTFNGERIDHILSSTDSLNANLHDNIACSLNAVIYDENNSWALNHDRLRNWISSFDKFGDESAEGNAFKVKFLNSDDIVVIKTPKNMDPKLDDLAHEALVGLYGMNKLRHILPNYMYVYGYFNCNPPIIKGFDVETTSWCSKSAGTHESSYLITEYIRDSVPYNEFLIDPDTSVFDITVVLYQLFNALSLAYLYYGYTHYDLHFGNVLVRKFNRKVSIPYLDSNTKVQGYFVSNYIPYIIDYGYSRIKVGNMPFAKIGLEKMGIDSSKSFPMMDVYKFICFSGYVLHRSKPKTEFNKTKYKFFDKLFSFFNEGALEKRVNKKLSNKNDFFVPDNKYINITYYAYIEWMSKLEKIPDVIIRDIAYLKNNNIILSPINNKLDICKFYDLVGSDKGPKTAFEYCDVRNILESDSSLTKETKDDIVKWLDSKFNTTQYVADTINFYESMINKTDRDMAFSKLSKINENQNLSSDISVNYAKMGFTYAMYLKEREDMLSSYIKSITCASKYQGTFEKQKPIINNMKNVIDKWKTLSDEIRERNYQNRNTVQNILSQDEIHPQYEDFWRNEYPALADLL